jgi:hypothetical protein
MCCTTGASGKSGSIMGAEAGRRFRFAWFMNFWANSGVAESGEVEAHILSPSYKARAHSTLCAASSACHCYRHHCLRPSLHTIATASPEMSSLSMVGWAISPVTLLAHMCGFAGCLLAPLFHPWVSCWFSLMVTSIWVGQRAC